jgi:hypothetical protein
MQKKSKAGDFYLRLNVDRELFRQFKKACFGIDRSMTEVIEKFFQTFIEEKKKEIK